MQVDVRKDMAAQIATSIAGVKDVDHASNADKIGGQSVSDLTKSISTKSRTPAEKDRIHAKSSAISQSTRPRSSSTISRPIRSRMSYQLDTSLWSAQKKSHNAADTRAEWVQFYLTTR